MPKTNPPTPPKRKTGPKPMDAIELRTHTVSVRLNAAELAELDVMRERVKMQRGEYLRSASAGILPPTIPEINREAWASLARVAGNLNQYQAQINGGHAHGHAPEVIQVLAEQVQKLRSQLLGLRK